MFRLRSRSSAKNLKFEVSPTPNFQESRAFAFTLNTGGSHRSKSAFSTPYGVEMCLNSIVVFSVSLRNTGLADPFFSAAAAGF